MIMQSFYDSPLGPLQIIVEDNGVKALYFENHRRPINHDAMVEGENDVTKRLHDQLELYFQGQLKQFDIPINPSGTEFQRKVWHALAEIPFGESRSYAQLAEAIGNPNAVRAVGAANGRNPISIVVPCHRVIGKDGSLTGYAGGLDRKRWLLSHEGII